MSSGDIIDHRIDSNGTPGWSVINIQAISNWCSFTVGIGINNIFNEAFK